MSKRRTVLRATIGAPVSAQRLWDVITDWQRQDLWIPLTRAWVVETGADGEPVRVAAWTGVGKIGFLDPMRIVTAEPPRHLVVDHLGRVVRGRAGFDIEPRGDAACRLTWWEEIEAPFGRVGALGLRALLVPMRLGLVRVLRTLVRVAGTDDHADVT